MRFLCLAAPAMPVVACAVGVVAQPVQESERAGRVILESPDKFVVVRGDHPRKSGLWAEYARRSTALRQNIVVSDVVYADSKWEDAHGRPTAPRGVPADRTGGNPDLETDFQNIHSEVWNLAPDTCAIGVWADTLAGARDAGAWGGIFSAKSHGLSLDYHRRYGLHIPEGFDPGVGPGFDAKLTGVEIDVLNEGLPGVPPNHSKLGLSIVGFGQPNSSAIAVQCQDSHAAEGPRRGQWWSVLHVKNALVEQGSLIVADFDRAKVGLDFQRALFTHGAARFRTEGPGTGVVLNEGRAGEVFGGTRGAGGEEWLSIRAGQGGVRVVSNDGRRELLAIHPDGRVELTGSVFLDGRRLDLHRLIALSDAPAPIMGRTPWAIVGASIGALAVAGLGARTGRRSARGDAAA